ncbi:MAG: maleylpyruvate isomerase N-terminal domain-containing protein [Actinomycetota bacterium]
MLRPATRVDVRQVMEQERAEFARLLRELTPEEAATPTICDPWTAHDLSVHLLGDDLSFLSRNRDAQRNPTLDSTPEWNRFVKELDAHNERWVEAGRFLSPHLIAELLETTGAMVAEFLAGVDPAAPGEVVSWAGPDPAPWWLVGGREFTERWVHHQQIRDALGRPGLNGPSFVGPILATAMHGVPRAYRDLDAPGATTVAFDVTGRAGFSWAVRRDDEGWKLYEGLTREADARLGLDQETAWRFLMGMLSAGDARHKVSVEGDPAYAEPFFDAVSAIVRRT